MSNLSVLIESAPAVTELFMTTQRSAGETATYPLWFVHDGDRLYALSAASSSEVWDVRTSSQVLVAIGAPDSDQRLIMQADIMDGEEWVGQMIPLLSRKYGSEHSSRMACTAEAAEAGGHVIIKFKPS